MWVIGPHSDRLSTVLETYRETHIQRECQWWNCTKTSQKHITIIPSPHNVVVKLRQTEPDCTNEASMQQYSVHKQCNTYFLWHNCSKLWPSTDKHTGSSHSPCSLRTSRTGVGWRVLGGGLAEKEKREEKSRKKIVEWSRDKEIEESDGNDKKRVQSGNWERIEYKRIKEMRGN